ncbi:carbohydrate ABC transporter permease [Anaeromyxobacter terrae]|uniref:carbohydrate ABC transporter permease n=1 Tax=Anaeromyxobacter terrae TaxID=2925406 RepID=UPI001F55BE53|nr:sugar ABC transporter permease [Anaeromyxobacter sp. SG22]
MSARGERRLGAALVAPAGAALALVALGPLLATAWLSLRHRVPVLGEDRFVGLANYGALAHDARFLGALANTAYFTALAVALELVLALPLALALHHAGRGRGGIRAAVLVPWILPTVVAAKLWALLLQPDLGLLARIWPDGAGAVLTRPRLALHAAIFVDVWKTTPFVALLLLAGLQAIPEDLARAARVDGASALRVFRSITLPLLRPAILLALLFRSLDAFRVFDVVFVLTEGGPGHTTEPLSLYAYRTLLRAGSFGLGAAISLVTFLCVVAIGLAWLSALGERRPAEAP